MATHSAEIDARHASPGAEAGKSLRILIDPRASTPAYDQALLTAMRGLGEEAWLFTADFYPDTYQPDRKIAGRRYFFLRRSRALRRRYKSNGNLVRIAILFSALEYPWDLVRLAALCWKKRPTLHIEWPFLLPFDILFLAFAKCIGVRTVYTVHNPLPHDKETSLNRFLYGTVYRVVDHLIFHGQATADDFKKLFPVEDNKWSIIPIGTGFANHTALSREVARRQLGWPEDETVILFQGQVKPYKGLDILLRAIAKMPPDPKVRLVVCANFRFANMGSFQELFDAARTKVVLEVVDEVPNDDRCVALACGSDLLVLPYRAGTASMPGMTAVRFGTPLIVTRVGALPEMLGDELSEYVVEPGDIDSLVAALKRFLSLDSSGREAFRNTLLQRGEDYFGWDSIARKTVDVYNALGKRRT